AAWPEPIPYPHPQEKISRPIFRRTTSNHDFLSGSGKANRKKHPKDAPLAAPGWSCSRTASTSSPNHEIDHAAAFGSVMTTSPEISGSLTLSDNGAVPRFPDKPDPFTQRVWAEARRRREA